MQPSATLQEIGAYVEQGHDFNYCFVVYTQGVSAISSSMLEDTNEAGAHLFGRVGGQTKALSKSSLPFPSLAVVQHPTKPSRV